MHQSEILDHCLTAAGGCDGKYLRILETGSIRGDTSDYRAGDGWSTLTFARHVNIHGGMVTSVDLDVSTAAKVLQNHELDPYVKLIRGYSIEVLTDMLLSGQEFDVILLDSDNDPRLILHEYMIAKRLLSDGGIIIVDDVDPESTTVLKGHALQPWLDDHDVAYRIKPRVGNGFTTGMMIIG